ncbi:Ger(x)C family spore germination protein [Sporosarcina sp. NPDC096371]|uniref:Ger(x)C family spore germination protein n=1 Tax=Sporosarcina sp. NPDC096371 TaxID=3364530 RepID=UPI0037FB87E6
MRRIGFILVICSSLLSGCWDEQQYKDVTNVSLVGIEGRPGNIKSQFAFPIFEDGSISYSTETGSGITTRGAKNSTNTSEGLDIAELQVLLLAGDSAKSDLYQYLDIFYRDPRNRLSAHLAIVEGEIAPYFELPEDKGKDVAAYYMELIDTAIKYSLIPKIDLQQVCTLLFTEDMSLALPYIKVGKESGVPEIIGTALFNKNEFTGEFLERKDSELLNLLKNKKGKYMRLEYLWKNDGEESPLAISVLSIKKDWEISDNKIDASYKLKVSIEEFPHDSLNKKKILKEVEDFLSKELEKDLTSVIKRLQEAKSDAVGFGRPVRAFHPKLWEQGEWTDTFSKLPIHVKVEAEVTRSGILN